MSSVNETRQGEYRMNDVIGTVVCVITHEDAIAAHITKMEDNKHRWCIHTPFLKTQDAKIKDRALLRGSGVQSLTEAQIAVMKAIRRLAPQFDLGDLRARKPTEDEGKSLNRVADAIPARPYTSTAFKNSSWGPKRRKPVLTTIRQIGKTSSLYQ